MITKHLQQRAHLPPIEELREAYGQHLGTEWINHPFERARLLQIKQRLADGLPPLDEPPQTPAPRFIPATRAAIAAHHNWPTLDQLTTDHMPPPMANAYQAILGRVREWRNTPTKVPTACILASPQVGIGKTHIALSVAASYHTIWGDEQAGFWNGRPNFQIAKNAIVLTAAELMERMDTDGYSHTSLIPAYAQCLVLDDVGREGDIRYTKRDEASQRAERQNRYFSIINHLYQRQKVALFLTTNLTAAQLDGFFNPATMSRLIEMTTGRYLIDITTKYPDMRRIRARSAP